MLQIAEKIEYPAFNPAAATVAQLRRKILALFKNAEMVLEHSTEDAGGEEEDDRRDEHKESDSGDDNFEKRVEKEAKLHELDVIEREKECDAEYQRKKRLPIQ